ncbi:MAG: PAS domain S-box protein [Rhodospirillaceae bacterium]|nr:PAS domain S-box protein [Rhodospirillaceae bacterium]
MNDKIDHGEEKFRNLIEASIEGVMVHRITEPIFVNQACADIFGYDSPSDIFTLESSMQLWAPHEWGRLRGYAEARLVGKAAPNRYEVEGRRRDGSAVYVFATARRIEWEGEEAIQSTIVDISEQKKAETEARLSEQHLADIIDHSADGIITINRKGIVGRFNAAAETMFGYTADEVVGRSISILLPESDRMSHDKYLEQSTLYGPRIINQARALSGQKKDGSTFPIELTVANLHDDGSGFVGVMRDISARVAAENRLKASEERFRQLAGISSDWVWETDKDFRFKAVYSAADVGAQLSTEPIGKTRQEITDPHELGKPHWQAHLADLEARREFKNFTFKLSSKKGSARYTRTSGTPIFDADGAFQGYRGTATDVTEFVEAEHKRQQLVDALESLTEAIAMFDEEDRFTFTNQAYREVNRDIPDTVKPGVKFEDHIWAAVNNGLVPEATGQEAEWVKRRMDHHISPSRSFEHLRQDGEWRMLQEQVLSNGCRVFWTTSITERKKLEIQVQHSEARFRDFASVSSDWFWEMDADLRFSYVSERWSEFSGIDTADIIGSVRQDLVGSIGGEEKWVHHFAQLANHEPFHDFTYQYDRAVGNNIWISTSGTPYFDEDGTFAGYRGTGRDITAERQASEHLETARAEAEHANDAKTQFLSSMSHELRTPLNAVIGFAQILELDADELTDPQREAVAQILGGSELLLRLINDVLDLSRVEAGHLSVSVEDVSVGELVNSVIEIVRPLANQHRVALESTGEKPLLATRLQCDRVRAQQVLINLLSNAIKYNRPNGEALLTVTAANSDKITFTVIDTGDGIAEAKQSGLFEPFNRLGAEHSSIEGTGIGLALSKRLVELMGGQIGFKSSVGRGSRFWVEFPYSDDVGKEPSQAILGAQGEKTTIPELSKGRVLYIEDSVANVLLMQRIFAQQSNVELIVANSGEIGIEMARAERPDLVLMDIDLPGMSGIDALETLRRDAATAKIPVIAISAAAMDGDMVTISSAGFDDYISKPIRIAEALKLFNRVLSNRLDGDD